MSLRRTTTTWAAAMILLAPATGSAQSPSGSLDQPVTLVGEVVDRSTGDPIRTARIALISLETDGVEVWVGSSDREGRFRSAEIPPGGYLIEVEALDFPAVSEVVLLSRGGVVDVDIALVPLDFELDPIVVVAPRGGRLEDAGFFDRQAQQGGTFLTREEIVDRNPVVLSDVLRRLAGVRVVGSGGIGGRTWIQLRRGCPAQIVLDGIRLAPPVDLDTLVDPHDLEGIEVHRGLNTPIQFGRTTTCGQLVLWTREPGQASQSFFDLLKVMGAAAFVAIAHLATH